MLKHIEAEFADPLGRVLAKSLFGARNAEQVRDELVGFCDRELGAPPADLRFFRMSVGAAFGLGLADGRELVLKAHLPRESIERLGVVQRVQRRLADASFPCPRPVGEPGLFFELPATVEELVAGGDDRDGHDPSVRRVMAETLARLVELTGDMERLDALGDGWSLPQQQTLWPAPHNALFDFEATAAGAEWIDRFAAAARERSAAGRVVAGHSDWAVKHFRFHGDRVHVIYDWDSLRLEPEPMLVAGAAVHFPYTEAFPVSRVASLDEIRCFVAEYEQALPTRFSEEERRAISAQAVYALAYTARCEHARDPSGARPAGSYREALAEFGEELLA